MWHIKDMFEISPVDATISLDITKFGKGKPNGLDGETVPCFSFFEVKEYLR